MDITLLPQPRYCIPFASTLIYDRESQNFKANKDLIDLREKTPRKVTQRVVADKVPELRSPGPHKRA